MVQLSFDSGNAAEAFTWVCTAPDLNLPYHDETLENAIRNGVFVGLHVASRSIVVHFSEPRQSKDARSKIQTILRVGGAAKKCLGTLEAFDNFHAESWGLITLNAPNIPEYKADVDAVIEEDDASDVEPSPTEDPQEEPDVPEAGVQEVAQVSPDIFALVAQSAPRQIRVPSMNKCLDLDTADQKELRNALVKAGGPLTEYLEETFFCRNKAHAQRVQEEHRALAMKVVGEVDTEILWLRKAPASITVYTKPKMPMKRRNEWIVWKAAKLNLDLNPVTFMALFKQASCYENKTARLNSYKEAMKLWQGVFDWKELDEDTRRLIQNINKGDMDCYCQNCKRVLNSKGNSKFCCNDCASKFCGGCGVKFTSRLVSDYEKMNQERNRLGHFRDLMDLDLMLQHREEVQSYGTLADMCPKFNELTQRRLVEKCCQGVEGLVAIKDDEKRGVKRWCQKCINEFQHLNKIRSYVDKIQSGKVNWGHVQAIVEQHNALRANVPKKQELFCAECEPPLKRQRL